MLFKVGGTALMAACSQGFIGVVQHLLGWGANVNIPDMVSILGARYILRAFVFPHSSSLSICLSVLVTL